MPHRINERVLILPMQNEQPSDIEAAEQIGLFATTQFREVAQDLDIGNIEDAAQYGARVVLNAFRKSGVGEETIKSALVFAKELAKNPRHEQGELQ